MTDEIILKIKKTLEGITYEKLILFGSQARGDSGVDSDYDLLIVIKDNLSITDKFSIMGQARKKLAEKLIDADVIVKSESELELYKNRIGSAARAAILEGVTI